MGLLNEMAKGGNTGGFEQQTSHSIRESVIATGSRLYDECDGEFEKHGRNLGEMLESGEEKSMYEAGMTMLMVKRTQDYLEAAVDELGEATVTQSLGSLPKRVLDVVRIFYPNQIATELVDIQPIDGKVGEIFTLKPRFSDTFGGVNAGDEVFKVRPTNNNYASEEAFEEMGPGDGIVVTFGGTFGDLLPMRPQSVKVVTTIGAAESVAVDDGNGNMVGVDVDSGTVDYETGTVSITYTTAPDDTKAVTLSYCYDSEINCGENIRAIEYDMTTTPVVAKEHPIIFKYSVAGALAAKAHLSIDTNETLAELAAQYIKHERDEYLVNLIDGAATAQPTLDFDASPAAGFSKQAKYAEIEIKLDEAESLIQDTQGRGGVDWILCGRNAAGVMRNMRGFQASQTSGQIGSHVIGTIRDGSVVIVKSLTLDKDTMIFGYKGYMAGDSACILAEWIPVYFTPTFQSPRLFNEQGAMSLYDMFINNAGYYVKGTVSNFAA